jgi:hypothetical protein
MKKQRTRTTWPVVYRGYLICTYIDPSRGYRIIRDGHTIQNFVATVTEAKQIIDMLVG